MQRCIIKIGRSIWKHFYMTQVVRYLKLLLSIMMIIWTLKNKKKKISHINTIKLTFLWILFQTFSILKESGEWRLNNVLKLFLGPLESEHISSASSIIWSYLLLFFSLTLDFILLMHLKNWFFVLNLILLWVCISERKINSNH